MMGIRVFVVHGFRMGSRTFNCGGGQGGAAGDEAPGQTLPPPNVLLTVPPPKARFITHPEGGGFNKGGGFYPP